VRFDGHAIEARLCAEDEDFIPHAGSVLHFQPPEGVRFDHALAQGMAVTPYYDSMLGKLIAHAATRDEALAQLAGALARLELLGLPTNRRLLLACLRHPRFVAGQARVPFLLEEGAAIRESLQKEEHFRTAACGLAALFPPKAGLELAIPFARPLRLRLRGVLTELRVRESDGLERPASAAVQLADGRWHVQAGAVDLFLEDASYDPPAAAAGAALGELRAPFNGKVIAVQAAAGARVARGDTLLVIESMKLEHVLAARQDGTVAAVEVQAGQQVATSQLLLRFA